MQPDIPVPGPRGLTDLVVRARALATDDVRRLLGICGPPGAGKSTLAAALADALGEVAVVVGMDGFHLADDELRRLGRHDRRGAPDTFDAAGYVALLQRLHAREEVTYAPEFRRDISDAVAGAVAVHRRTPLVITEGNYLLLDDPPWNGVGDQLDEVWWVDLADDVRLERLTRRHEAHGKSPADAAAWARGHPTAAVAQATRPPRSSTGCVRPPALDALPGTGGPRHRRNLRAGRRRHHRHHAAT